MAYTIEMLVRLAPLLSESVDVLVDLKVVKVFTSLSKAYIYELEKRDATFPARVSIGKRTVWSLWGVQRWSKAKIAAAESVREESLLQIINEGKTKR